MAAKKPSRAEERLNHLQVRVCAWQQTRQRYARMPPALWNEATSLSEELGASTVQQALAINRTSLLRRMEEREAAEDGNDAPAFVELMRESTRTSAGPEIELEDGTGMRMTIRLSPGCELNVAQVVGAFRGTR